VPLYFAYGSNMDVEAMACRCPRSKALGLARLERHRLSVMREGWLTAVRAPSSAVHGVLRDLALSDIAALDRYEGVSQGFYVKLTQAVIADLRKRYPQAENAELANYLITAYCPVVAGQPQLSEAERKARLDQFVSQLMRRLY